jgi:hypothetical protein
MGHGLQDLGPHMSTTWRNRVGVDGGAAPAWKRGHAGAQTAVPVKNLHVNVDGSTRGHAAPEDAPLASSREFSQAHVLDRCGIGRAIILGEDVQSLAAFADLDRASTLASARNDWSLGETLMYNSDYPHWDFGDPKWALASVPTQFPPDDSV